MSSFVGKQRSFRFLWVGQMLANLGDILYIVCLIKIIFTITGSATFMSLVPFFNTFSALLSGLVAPLIIQKYKLKSILVYSQSGKTVLLLCLCLISPFLEEKWLLFIFILISLISFLDGWANPARNAFVPSLVEETKLVKTNSLLSISDQITQLIAWPIGSILLVSLGAERILWLTFIFYLCSTFFMVLIKDVMTKSENDVKQSKAEVLKEGWSIIWNSKKLRTISMMNVLETMANGVWIAAILFVYVSEILNKGESWWGFINGSFFGGMLFAGLLIYRYSSIVEKNLGKTILLSTFCLSVLTISFGFNRFAFVALSLSFLFGLPQMARDVAETTIIQKSAREQVLAKVYSARGTLLFGVFGLSSLLMGWITDHFGVHTTFSISGCLFILSFLIALIKKKELLHETNKNI